ncbi:hypothetical protein HNY73_000617 [Argiope bruennichi]|uniref:Uncharacterized protein n=1 Tax=Argiope bruennichi TaxID=94029 RepID=A0A8T0FYM1_ARGBR|nr:hypothetical protein HNY73_000617 [Argiope bruennichi]
MDEKEIFSEYRIELGIKWSSSPFMVSLLDNGSRQSPVARLPRYYKHVRTKWAMLAAQALSSMVSMNCQLKKQGFLISLNRRKPCGFY